MALSSVVDFNVAYILLYCKIMSDPHTQIARCNACYCSNMPFKFQVSFCQDISKDDIFFAMKTHKFDEVKGFNLVCFSLRVIFEAIGESSCMHDIL